MLKVLSEKRFNFRRFFVGEGPQVPPYFLHTRRVYILPTKQGLVFTGLLFGMLLGSVNYNNNLGYILTFLLSSLLVVTIFMTYRNLLYLKIGPAIPTPVFAGKKASIPIEINNHNYSARFSIEYYQPKQAHKIGDIAANTSTSITLDVNFTQRGRQAIPRFIIETNFPLGFFRTWAHVELQQSVLVYPHPSADTRLPPPGQGNKEGEHQITAGNDDFDGLRNYHRGDSLYRVHWKSSARHHVLQTKLYNGNASDELWISWDDSSCHDIEQRISQLTCWVLLADTAGIPYGFQMPGVEYPMSSGLAHRDNCLKALALYGTNDV